MPIKRIILLALIITAFIYAEVMYEITTTTEGMMGKSESLIRNFIKGQMMRIEVTTIHPTIGEIKNTTIIRLDKELIWTLDEAKKEYSEFPLGSDTQNLIDTVGPIPEIDIKRFDEKKKILNYVCEKYVVSIVIKSKDGDIRLNQTLWVCKDFPGYDEIIGFNRSLMAIAPKFYDMGIAGIDQRTLEIIQKKISEIEGFPLRTEIEFNVPSQGTPLSFKTKSEVGKIVTVPISDRVFEVQEVYKLKKD